MHPRDAFRARWRARSGPALISVHRGLWGHVPENSLGAIAAGAPMGIVEIDVQLSQDGVPIVMHDPTFERMCGDSRSVSACTRDEIVSLRLKSGLGGPDAPLTDETVPDLATAIAAMPKDGFFDFDVKFPHEVEQVAAAIAAMGLQSTGSLKIDTDTRADIAELRALEDRYGLMVMAKVHLTRADPDVIGALVDAGVAAAEVWFDTLDDLRAACARAGDDMAISTYTLNPVHCCGLSDDKALDAPDPVWGTLIAAGVTIIMTDETPALAAYLATR